MCALAQFNQFSIHLRRFDQFINVVMFIAFFKHVAKLGPSRALAQAEPGPKRGPIQIDETGGGLIEPWALC